MMQQEERATKYLPLPAEAALHVTGFSVGKRHDDSRMRVCTGTLVEGKVGSHRRGGGAFLVRAPA